MPKDKTPEQQLAEAMNELRRSLAEEITPPMTAIIKALDGHLERHPRLYAWTEKPMPQWVVYISPIHWLIWLWTGRRPHLS